MPGPGMGALGAYPYTNYQGSPAPVSFQPYNPFMGQFQAPQHLYQPPPNTYTGPGGIVPNATQFINPVPTTHPENTPGWIGQVWPAQLAGSAGTNVGK